MEDEKGRQAYKPGLFGTDPTRGYKPISSRRYRIDRTTDLVEIDKNKLRRNHALRVEGYAWRLWSGRDIFTGKPGCEDQEEFLRLWRETDGRYTEPDDLEPWELDEYLGEPPKDL